MHTLRHPLGPALLSALLVLLWASATALAQTGVSEKRVNVGRDDGLWEVRATADGGCTVHYELRYDPAGSVPGFMVKWFQGSGFKDMLSQLRAYVDQKG